MICFILDINLDFCNLSLFWVFLVWFFGLFYMYEDFFLFIIKLLSDILIIFLNRKFLKDILIFRNESLL